MNTELNAQTQTEIPLYKLFDIRTANEWLDEARILPMPKALFGDLWLEDELALLFADTGLGKSILAVQIAHSIAAGAPLAPFETAEPQPVVYLDFASSKKQVEIRYTDDHEAEDGEYLKNHFSFSDNFYRVHIDPFAPVPKGFGSFHEYIHACVEQAVRETGARVFIVDSITQLKRSNNIVRDMLPMMGQLHLLKREFGLSILVLAQAPKRDVSRPITASDLHGAKLLSNFADNIFAIGQSSLNPRGRYIKHIKPQSTELFYGSAHVPSFRVEKIGGNFLGFVFESFASEMSHLRHTFDEREWATIDKIKQMANDGMTLRDIGEELGISKTTAHRLHQMWVPPPEAEQSAAAAAVVKKTYDFPGCEEYDSARSDPRFSSMYTDEDDEDYRLRREYADIDRARADAREEYLETGEAPTLAEMLARGPTAAANGSGSELHVLVGGAEAATEGWLDNGFDGESTTQPDTTSTNAGVVAPANTGGSDISAGRRADLTGLRRSLDNNGREIFIEKEHDHGKPVVWYRYDAKGKLHRWERKGYACLGDRVDGPICLLNRN